MTPTATPTATSRAAADLKTAPQTVAAGSTVVFNAAASNAATYRWERNGVAIPGATSSTLVINNASAANAGTYVNFAVNGIATVASDSATLSVVDTNAVDVGHLVNLSILTSAGAGAKVLTMDTEGPNFTDGKLTKYQDIIEILSDNERTLSSRVLGEDGQWLGFMKAVYRRKK